MAYSFTAEHKPTYLHAKGCGEQSEANVRQFLIDAYRACVERNASSLLLEMAFTGRSLGVGSVYSVIAERSLDGSKLARIAYVDANPEHTGDMAEFAEMVARNRGVNVRLFTDLAQAERWLQTS